MTADSSLSIRTVHLPQSDLPIQIESESEVKSSDRIKTSRHKKLTVHVPRARNNPVENGSDRHLQAVLMEAQYIQI